jgi:hypothetical protein
VDEEKKDQLFEQLFPIPPDRPRRTLRFGNIPGPKDLPELSLRHDARAARPPFQIVWEDPHLGLRFTLREREGGDVLANVDADTQAHVGKTVSLALTGSDASRQVRRKIQLAAREHGGCGGGVSFGTLEELSRELGPSVQPSHFLIG